jgi:hypothetical protein
MFGRIHTVKTSGAGIYSEGKFVAIKAISSIAR